MFTPIKIATRNRPYSHRLGEEYLLPGTSLSLQLFPSCIKVIDISKDRDLIATLSLQIKGPMSCFTVMMDLEKGSLIVFGQTQCGYLRYRLLPVDQMGLALLMEKCPGETLLCELSSDLLYGSKEALISFSLQKRFEIAAKEKLYLINPKLSSNATEKPSLVKERLSLGNHKAQDYCLMQRRCDPAEIIPIWYALSQFYLEEKQPIESFAKGTFALLEHCRQLTREKEKTNLLSALMNLFKASYRGVFVPQLTDSYMQGFCLPEISTIDSQPSIHLLTKSGALIRDLFFQVNESEVTLLPCIPPEFHCGRFLSLKASWGRCDIEWTKKKMRRAFFYFERDGKLTFNFPKAIKEFRLRKSPIDRGEVYQNFSSISYQTGNIFYLDRFMQ